MANSLYGVYFYILNCVNRRYCDLCVCTEIWLNIDHAKEIAFSFYAAFWGQNKVIYKNRVVTSPSPGFSGNHFNVGRQYHACMGDHSLGHELCLAPLPIDRLAKSLGSAGRARTNKQTDGWTLQSALYPSFTVNK